MSIAVIATLVLLEAAYIFISLKAIIREKLSVTRNAFLFLGIIAANLGSGFFLYATPFRFLLFSLLSFGLIKLLCRENVYFYNLFLVMAVYTVKAILEIAAMLFVVYGVVAETPVIFIAVNILLLIFPVLTFKYASKFRDFVSEKLGEERTFFVRYGLVMIMNIGVLAFIYVIHLVIHNLLMGV